MLVCRKANSNGNFGVGPYLCRDSRPKSSTTHAMKAATISGQSVFWTARGSPMAEDYVLQQHHNHLWAYILRIGSFQRSAHQGYPGI